MNELKPEDVMRALEEWIYNFNGTANQFCALCDALALLREKDEIIKEFEHQSKIALKRIEEKDAKIKKLEDWRGLEFTCFVGDPHRVDHCPYCDEIVRLQKENAEKDAEIERLKKDREELIVTLKMNDAPFPEGLQIVHDFCEKCKKEAIAEKDAEIMRIKGEIEALVQIANSDNPLLVTVARSEALADAVAQLEAVVDSSDKYIAEYDDSELQRAYNKGVRDALAAVRQLQEAEDAE